MRSTNRADGVDHDDGANHGSLAHDEPDRAGQMQRQQRQWPQYLGIEGG